MRRVLVSFHYFAAGERTGRHIDMRAWLDKSFSPGVEVFADSGGFSAHTMGATIRRANYAAWCRDHADVLDVVATLDAIGNAEKTWANTMWLRERGVPALHVFHFGEPWSYLDRMLEAGEPYMALGGMVGRPYRPLRKWVAECFERAAGSNTQFHGFGLTRWPMLRAFPWYSVDSTSWVTGGKFGDLTVFDPRRGEWVERKRALVAWGHRHRPSARRVAIEACHDLEVASVLRHYGIDPRDLSDPTRFGDSFTRSVFQRAIGAASWIEAEDWLRARSPRARVDGHPECGTKIFLAIDPAYRDVKRSANKTVRDLVVRYGPTAERRQALNLPAVPII